MNKNSIWFISGIGIIGFAIGILFIAQNLGPVGCITNRFLIS